MAFVPTPLQNLLTRLVKEFLTDRLNYLVTYEKKVQELDKVVGELQVERDRVRHKVEEEENRHGREIDYDVKEWLDGVDNILSEYDKFAQEEDREYAGCSHGIPPNPATRYRRSRTAEDIATRVNAQLQMAKHDSISHWRGPPSLGFNLSYIDYESFESRNVTMENIMAALEDSSVRMIGVHGLSGVGKTTLVLKVASKAREDKLFNVVIVANVTRNPDIRKIQGQIADMLGIELVEESEIARAARIRERLKKEKENTLIILDDVWAKLDLEMLGIPSENDDGSQKNLKERESHGAHNKTEKKLSTGGSDKMERRKFSGTSNKIKSDEAVGHYKGCKLMLISVTRKVLLSQMGGKENPIFHLDVLEEKEAQMLFRKMAGIDDKNSEFGKLAAQIANKCEGLPMSIVTTARALKDQSRAIWEDVHRELERQKFTGTPECSTKLSYDLLENEELKYVFLLCARMGHDALVMDLVKYCIGMGFLQGIYTAMEARDRVQALLVKLKESSLLSNSYLSDRFTMPDVVRRAALSIASKEKHVFMLTKVKLDEWPDEDKLERYTVISLQHCDTIEEFPESINCPRLGVFHVHNNDPRLRIPENFFKRMRELRVLILIGIHLSPLPSSIRCLTKLRMLCLEQCTLSEQLHIIGELKNLRILSLSGSDIEKLPVELKQLSKLQIFDISNCSKLRVIPPNVISSLTSLEELYMRNNLIEWNIEGEDNQSENASLSELGHLNQLTNLDIQIPHVAHLPKNLFFDKLHSYKIVIGDLNAYIEPDFKMPEKYEAVRFLGIQLKDGFDIHSQKGIKMLFERVENLLLEELNGVQDIFYELNLKGFPYLKHLSIVSNSSIQSLINPKDRQHPEKAFPKLESLCLCNLKIMEEICSCKLSAPSFAKLKIIKIKLCGQLKYVFLASVVRLLTVLETIEVSECNSMKEIVAGGAQSNTAKIEFPELRSFTLQSLPNFIGFNPTSSLGESRKLFHKEVVVSKLERLKLSSIQIDEIWSDLPSPSSYFGNLIHLDVDGCWNLKYLLSFSMSKCLVNLQSLFVSKCEKMRHIFRQVLGSDAKMKGSFFPNLRNIKLSSMKSLSEIWNAEVPLDSFGKLDSLTIVKCDKLANVFPSYTVGIFRSLSNLKVTNCKSMTSIFDLKDRNRDAGDVTNLQDVHLETLPKLKHVWKLFKDQQGILNLNNLQKIRVHDCDSLENIFPFSVANSLKNLEFLVVRDCFGLKEIVAKGEGSNNDRSSTVPFVFPKLATIKFSKLPKFNSFYPGAYELSCPALNELSVELCDKLEPFGKETTGPPRNPVLFPEEVINKLKSMQIESRHATASTGNMGTWNYRRDNLEELHLSRLMNTEILYFFLHSNPNLKSLTLDNCFFQELVPLGRPPEIENLGVVPKLKSLKLIDLPDLEKIGFERDTVLQRIEFLILKNCPRLLTLVPSSVSFTRLTNLEVVNCDGLKSLMPPSTAKSLVQLNFMKVMNCESLEEIVSEQGNEENAGKIDIVLRQLKAIELGSLKSLKSFCSCISCAFEFPSLEKLVVNACPKLEKFSEVIISTPILHKVYVVHQKEKKRWYWKGNLNATIQKMFEEKNFFEGMDELSFSDHLELLQEVWHGKIGLKDNWFNSVRTLKLENCELQPYAIPSSVLPCLKSLKELHVRNCINITVIFDMNDTKIMGTTSQLKKLYLDELPNMKHVWDKNLQGILIFQNLQEVLVSNCNNLQTVFPAALAKNLKKLEDLDVHECEGMLEIVGKEEEAGAEATDKFSFPLLTSLYLYELPQLTCFYPERFTMECPMLNRFGVLNCGKLDLFQSHQQANPNDQGSSTSIKRQPVFLDLKAISNLEELTINWKDTSVLRLSLGQFMEDLQYLQELYLFFEDDVNGNSTLPFEILEKAPNLETMAIRRCSSLKKPPTQNPKTGEDGMLGHLKTLFLVQLFELQPIGLDLEDSSWLNWICEKLNQLCVHSCPPLMTLVHPDSAVSFSNLKGLFIYDCHGLKCLFTSSAAKMLMHLEEMYVWLCESIKEIVAKEEDVIPSEDIIFERLERISLESLSSLKCFYSGNATLRLPSLIQLEIWECPKMNVFSQGPIHAESFRGMKVSLGPTLDLVFHDDLNATVNRQFLHQANLGFGDYPDKLREIWLGDGVPDRPFINLKSLVVEGCEFLLNAILPSRLLPFLIKLEVLEVRKCNSVESIFDVIDKPAHHTNMISIPLKKLILEKLPTLKHVWNEDPQGSLTLPLLEVVLIDGCESIQSLFPASVAKDRLRKLDVKNCVGLVEIVQKDEAATEEATKEVIMFPSVTTLRLWNLPNLMCIYSGMQILEWPVLKKLDVYHCQMLKIFAKDFQSCPDSYSEGQRDQQAFVSVEKVSPNLKQLSLTKEDAMMIEQGLLHVDLQNLKFLKLQCFHNESDVFPHAFLSKVPLPGIKKLGVVDSTFEEIFPSQSPDIDYTKILSQLKGLELKSLSKLKSIGLEHSWMSPLLENLETLQVLECNCLTNLAPSTVSFYHLTELIVENCDRLEYLFTSSTAKSLHVLNNMCISNCVSLEKIVAEEGDGPHEDLVIFGKLNTLSLSQLPKLGSFYTGSSTLKFPSLDEVSFTQCHSMKIFCHGDVEPKTLQGKIDGVRWYGDLNTWVKRQFGEGSSLS